MGHFDCNRIKSSKLIVYSKPTNMKKTILFLVVACAIFFVTPQKALAQAAATNVVNIQQLKTKWPENGSLSKRDSLVSLYNENVIWKNTHILSHREYSHWFTGDNHDYLVIEEYKDMAGIEASFAMNTELENKAWPDEMKRKEFFKALGEYFEDWHGDALYRTNPKHSKN